MRPFLFIRLLPVLAVALLLQACATAPRTPEGDALSIERYETRADELRARTAWALKGRLAVNDGNDGGSGSLSWRENPGGRRMDFHGVLGRGAWRLDAGEGGAELELADGSRYRAESVEELVRGQLGWEIPVEALAWWVRGLEAPGKADHRTLGEDGTLEFLSQRGWDIEYGRYRQVDGVNMPLKLSARQAHRTVKLAVRDWALGENGD